MVSIKSSFGLTLNNYFQGIFSAKRAQKLPKFNGA
jgi:hypothetical protein